MGYTKRQLDKILNVGGKPFILPEQPVPYSMRVCESLIRRRLYALEDEAVAHQFRMYKAAYNDIRNRALDLAQQYNVNELTNTGNVIKWRRAVDGYTQQVAAQLADSIAKHALKSAGDMYTLGYFGRAWALDMATKPDQTIRVPIPNSMTITKAVLQPGLAEAFEPDTLIYNLLGIEWRQAYKDILDEMVRKIRNTLNSAIQQKLNVQSAMQLVADAVGVSISKADGFKANFNRLQALTRTYTMNAANEGALGLYQQNADLLQGVQFLASQSRVCDVCNDIAKRNEVWPLNSNEIIKPPVHVNCRCTLIPVLSTPSETGSDPTAPPAQTWQQWVLASGIGWLLGSDLTDVNTGDDIDSSQVGEDDPTLQDVL